MNNCAWIFCHITRCRKCSRKFAALKAKYEFKHKNTEYNNFKDLSPEAVERVKICYGACIFIAWNLESICNLEDMGWHVGALEMIEEDIEIKNPERYLNYKTAKEGWSALRNAGHWLSEMELEERFFLFRDLARIFILTWDKEAPERKCPVYIPDQNISYIADELGIPKNIAYQISEEELWDQQRFWAKRKREKNQLSGG